MAQTTPHSPGHCSICQMFPIVTTRLNIPESKVAVEIMRIIIKGGEDWPKPHGLCLSCLQIYRSGKERIAKRLAECVKKKTGKTWKVRLPDTHELVPKEEAIASSKRTVADKVKELKRELKRMTAEGTYQFMEFDSTTDTSDAESENSTPTTKRDSE